MPAGPELPALADLLEQLDEEERREEASRTKPLVLHDGRAESDADVSGCVRLLLNAASIDVAQAIVFCGLPVLVHPLLRSIFFDDSLEEAIQQVEGRIGQVSPAKLLQELEDSEPSILSRGKELSEGKLAQEVLQWDGWRGQVAARLELIEKQVALSILGLGQSADSTSITKAFKRRAVELHPDKGGDLEEFQLLQQMKDVLLGAKMPAMEQHANGVGEAPKDDVKETSGDSEDTDDEIDKLLGNRGAEGEPAPSRASRKAELQANRVKLHQAVTLAWSRCGRLCSQLSTYKQEGQGQHREILASLEEFLVGLEDTDDDLRFAADGTRLGRLVVRGAECLSAAAVVDPEATVAMLMKSRHVLEIEKHERWPLLTEAIHQLPSQVDAFLAATRRLGLPGAATAKSAGKAESGGDMVPSAGSSVLMPRESALQAEGPSTAAAAAVASESAQTPATCQRGCVCTKFQSPYALEYFGAGAEEDNEDEDCIDYGQYTLPAETIFEEESEFIRPSQARRRAHKEYVVDNSDLQADAPGVAFRFSRQLNDRDDVRPVAQWGCIDTGDGWVQIGDRFLPQEVGGKKVLLERAPSKFRAEDRLDDLDDLDEDEVAEESAEPWKGTDDRGKRRETPEQRRQRLQQAEQLRAQDKEHEEHEQRSRELLRKHKMLLHEPDMTHYTVLGLARNATPEDIERAYKALSSRYHPDKAVQADRAIRASMERSMVQLNEAFAVLSNPKHRWNYDRTLPPVEEKVEITDHLRSAGAQPGRDIPVPDGADADFDFSGEGRPFRFCRGKAARVAKICGSRDKVRIAMHQLVGKVPMELADCGGVIRHVGPMTPFGGLGECGHSNCMAHRLRYPEVRTGFRDFIVTSELLERLREEAGVQIAQICLIDIGYRQPSLPTRRALREFADWQRASAQMRRVQPCEILVFGHLADYSEASAKGGRASNCHVFVQCDTHWNGCSGDCSRLASRALCKDGLLARLAEGPDALHAELPKGVLVSPFQGDLEAPQEMETLGGLEGGLDSDQSRVISIARAGGLHVGEPFFSAAWTLVEWPPEFFKTPSLQPKEHPLLSRREDLSRARQIAKDHGLSVWRVAYKPRIAVRAAPDPQAPIVDLFYAGDELLAVPCDTQGPWLRLAKASWPNPTDAPEEDAWVLHDGAAAGLGLLVEQVYAPP
eukprot:s572_g15.t1